MAADKRSDHDLGTADAEAYDQVVPINRLHLDLANFRHEQVHDETQAITTLCGSEQVVALAEDISRRGLSPLDVIGVVPMVNSPGHFVTVEGNRRTCALIVTADPSRAPTHLRPKFEQIRNGGNFPNAIKVHVFPNKAAAKSWIDLRHLGPQDGVGVKPWNATQKARAATGNRRTSAGDNALAVSVLDRLVEQGLLTKGERNKVPVSTITRYLSSPTVREVFGLSDRNALVYTHDAAEVDSVLLRLIRDSIDPQPDGKFRVHSRSNANERVQYAYALKAEGATPSTRLTEPAAPPGRGAANANAHTNPKQKTRNAPNPDARHSLVPSDFKVPIKDNVLARLRGEAVTLQVEDYSFSANFLLRAMVERTLSLLVKKHGKWRDDMTDGQLTQVCADQLKGLSAPRDILGVINKASGNKATPYNLHSLGFAVHGGSIPTGQDLKRYFDTWRPVLDFILGHLHDK